ncbi:MAG: precorrin-3B C(17)-methyltransferase [Thermodesulfobacterium sp.]|jgi:cobalt-precorrin 5A hydrolase/precorrin-3B C17-methyltransferase|nr:precorrin-3B C(17)-methyltransferase [Thermodesulfobacterium sp.]
MEKNLMSNIAIFYLNNKGLKLANKIFNFFPHAKVCKFSQDEVKRSWEKSSALLFIMATGIVVRTVAPLIKNKKEDPAVLVIDEEGKHVIPLLGGHQARANELATTLATLINATPVITTSSDINNLPPLDLWIERCQLFIQNPSILPKIMSKFIENRKIKIHINSDLIRVPIFSEHFEVVKEAKFADIIITNKKLKLELNEDQLVLIPRNLVVGLGFHDWVTSNEIEEAVKKVFTDEGLYFEALKGVATLEKKAKNEALQEFSRKYGLSVFSYTPEKLQGVRGLSSSPIVERTVGVSSVCEQSAILASRGRLIVSKRVFKDLTIAVAEAPYYVKGKVYVVGIGPGSLLYITPKAITAIREADVIIGYKTYINQIESLIKDKMVFAYGMTEEVKRAKTAIEYALKGMKVSVISGGDPGVYGMAGLIFEILAQNNLEIEVEVIPGISAFNAASSMVGAPIMNDFACISLSDRLTPWHEIGKRLEYAIKSDFVIILYNPKSSKRRENLTKAKGIILKYRDKNTPVAIVKNVTREGEEVILTTLEKIDSYPVDMNTTIIIGNSQSYIYKNFFITPRGYTRKYEKEYELISDLVG